MNISINQTQANKLIKIYNMLDSVKPSEFNQNDCDKCIMGQLKEYDLFNRPFYEGFNATIRYLGFGEVEKIDYDQEQPYLTKDLMADYLFGESSYVTNAAKLLELTSVCKTPKDGQKRIKALLDKASYDIEFEEKWYYV